MKDELSTYVVELKRDEVIRTVEARLGSGEDPLKILDQCRQGMTTVGDRFQAGDYYLAELMLSAEVFKGAIAVLDPHLKKARLCLHGDVPAALLTLGKLEDVGAYCRKLIHEVGNDGGFILGSGCSVPPNVKPENFRAMIETGKNYELSGN